MLIYVNDIVITGSSSTKITKFITTLASEFKFKDMRNLQYLLGMEFSQIATTNSYVLLQHRYICDLLWRTNMQNCKPAPTLITSTTRLNRRDDYLVEDITLYRSTIGALLYLVNTQSDIAFVVNKLCQFLYQPTTVHWPSTKRVLRHLQGTSTHRIVFAPSPTFVLVAPMIEESLGDLQCFLVTTWSPGR